MRYKYFHKWLYLKNAKRRQCSGAKKYAFKKTEVFRTLSIQDLLILRYGIYIPKLIK